MVERREFASAETPPKRAQKTTTQKHAQQDPYSIARGRQISKSEGTVALERKAGAYRAEVIAESRRLGKK